MQLSSGQSLVRHAKSRFASPEFIRGRGNINPDRTYADDSGVKVSRHLQIPSRFRKDISHSRRQVVEEADSCYNWWVSFPTSRTNPSCCSLDCPGSPAARLQKTASRNLKHPSIPVIHLLLSPYHKPPSSSPPLTSTPRTPPTYPKPAAA